MMDQATVEPGDLGGAIARASARLLELQQSRGHWQGVLEAHADMEAIVIFLHRLLGRDETALDRRLADRLLALQQGDGAWTLGAGAPSDVSVTVEAYYALRLVGHASDETPLVRAREFILAHGGPAAASVSTRLWLALFGQCPWSGVPALPVEIVLLPPWSPLNIYALAGWMRSAIVPAALLLAHRDALAVRDAPAIPELWGEQAQSEALRFRRSTALVTWRNAFLAFERALRVLGGHPWEPVRRRAVARAIEWVLRHQDANGQWGGNLPATVYALTALHAVGFAPDHPVMVSGIGGAHDFLVEHERTLVAQPASSATRDTVLAMHALLAAGTPAGHPALARATDWLVTSQIFRSGDWAVARPGLEPGGWTSALANDWYPETDLTGQAIAALAAVRAGGAPLGRRALAYGVNWLLGMQGRAGGWAVCDPDGAAAFLAELPFAEGEGVTDPPAADVTGQVLVGLAAAGFGIELARARRGVEFLRGAQRTDGSWTGRTGALQATWCALAGLSAIGEDLRAPVVRRAVEWLFTMQHADGGWGETGESSPVQTAWALLALLAAGVGDHTALDGGVAYLTRKQGADGAWTEPVGTAPGFGRCPVFRQDLAAVVYPLLALGRYRSLGRPVPPTPTIP